MRNCLVSYIDGGVVMAYVSNDSNKIVGEDIHLTVSRLFGSLIHGTMSDQDSVVINDLRN